MLPCWDTHTVKIRRCEKSVIGCITWCVGGCECFSQSQYTHCPEQTIGYCNWLELWEFIKFTFQTLNAQLSVKFTDHQRVVDWCSHSLLTCPLYNYFHLLMGQSKKHGATYYMWHQSPILQPSATIALEACIMWVWTV